MRPAFIDDMSWEMAEVYGAITDQILINLARHFPYFKPENLPGSAFAYQADMLAQMGQVNRESVRIIRNGLKNADDALQGCLEQAIIDSIKSVNPALYKAAKAGILKMPTSIVTAPNQMRAFQLYYQQAAQKLNLVNTVMLESTKQAYQATVADIVNRVQATQTALDIGAGEVVTGVSSWNQAMVHSINRMKANGITGFIDHGGHRWSAEAYTAMDIRTTMANTARAAVLETNQDFGNDLYSVSYHDGARPLCYPWQNKVISSLDRSGVTYDLDGNEIPIYPQSSTSYGQPAGLFGINCKHYPTPFIPGVSLIRGQPMSEEANKQAYEDSQKQRALERKIREEKRDLLMMKAQGAPDEVIKAQRAKIRQTDDDIDNFCAETGRARRQNREGVYTERKFPSADTYDVTQFERTQKELIDKYFENGGVHQSYTFGQMTPNEPITPVTPVPTTETPVVNNAPVQETPQDTFSPAQTRAEAEAYAREHFAENVDYTGMSIENANKVNETLAELTRDYPIDRLDNISQRPIGAVARARHDNLEINGKKLGKVLKDEEINFKLNQAFTRNELEMMRKRYEGKAKIPRDVENKMAKLENELRFTRYGVHSSHTDHVRAVISHEYGHILSDQYFGMLNRELANPNYSTNWSLRGMSDRWRQAYDKAFETGDIYSLSQYGSKNPREFFAECFAARFMGETLPDYVESLMVEVLANGIM
jgi:hypothetical protein